MAKPLRNAVREARKVAGGHSPTHEHLRGRLVALFLASVIVDLVGSILILQFERDQPGTAITTFDDALFWTSTQLLTV